MLAPSQERAGLKLRGGIIHALDESGRADMSVIYAVDPICGHACCTSEITRRIETADHTAIRRALMQINRRAHQAKGEPVQSTRGAGDREGDGKSELPVRPLRSAYGAGARR